MKTETIRLPEELFKSWLEDETAKISEMKTIDEVQAHIMSLEQIIFETKTRLSVSHKKRIELQGGDWAKNSKAISDPTFKVNYKADPRERGSKAADKPKPKTKEEKESAALDAAGVDKNKLKELIKAKMLEKAMKAKSQPSK